ncbi:MAG TPA: 2'-5' RNA ligase family protein [Candidatus Rifleibacterium sp.]|nr:2'-5' RNA ligase family protein [Candidatus Rifleibacterium sp.]HPT44281.1 2'-5' RNA ligase family protein [Candidatus Rifleibacterium sp.]
MFESGKTGFFMAIPALIILAIVLTAGMAVAEPMVTPPPVNEKINVFAVVSGEIETACHDAATALMNEEALESFALKGYQVHCTLYMTQYPANSLDKVAAIVTDLASNTREFEIQSTGLEITSGNWFFMNLERNRSLQTLSDQVVEKLAALRHPSNFVPEWAKDNATKVEYITKYGSPNVYAEFNPHLTLLAQSDGSKLQRFMQKHATDTFNKPITGRVVAVGLGIADRDGQMQTPYKILPLQPAGK